MTTIFPNPVATKHDAKPNSHISTTMVRGVCGDMHSNNKKKKKHPNMNSRFHIGLIISKNIVSRILVFKNAILQNCSILFLRGDFIFPATLTQTPDLFCEVMNINI